VSCSLVMGCLASTHADTAVAPAHQNALSAVATAPAPSRPPSLPPRLPPRPPPRRWALATRFRGLFPPLPPRLRSGRRQRGEDVASKKKLGLFIGSLADNCGDDGDWSCETKVSPDDQLLLGPEQEHQRYRARVYAENCLMESFREAQREQHKARGPRIWEKGTASFMSRLSSSISLREKHARSFGPTLDR
jgi:hypothetical protein